MRVRDRATSICALLALAVAVFAVGGAPRWAQAVCALLSAGALAPQLLSRRGFERLSPLTLALLVATIATAVQLIPLPKALVAALDPVGQALREDGTSLFDVDTNATLTRDVPGSLRALVFFVTLLAIGVTALRMSATERGRYQVLAAVAGVCGLAALVVGVHELFGLTSLYGVYEPQHIAPHILGPLLNPNHLGCLMAAGSLVALALVGYRRQRAWLRIVWIVVFAMCGAATLATLSRGATVSLIAGGFVVAAVLLGQRFVRSDPARKRATFFTSSLPIGVVAACALVVVLYASAGGVAEQLSHTSLHELREPRSKFATWRSSVQLIEESPWTGVGRGGFEPSFTRVHPASAFSTFSHVENEYLQAVIDWGIPVAILLAVSITWLGIVVLRRWREGPLAAGALGALTAVMLQSNFDFGLELLGVAVPITAIAATLAYVPLREMEGARRTRARMVRGAHLIALAAGALCLLLPMTTSIAEDHQETTKVEEAVARHPLDYLNYARTADRMLRAGDRNAVRMLNHAMVLHPSHAGLHLLAARMLIGTGHPDQAIVEYSAALQSTLDPHALLAEIARRYKGEQAARAIPADDRRTDVIVNILVDELKRPDIATPWLIRSLQFSPGNLRACDRLFDMAIANADLTIVENVNRNCPQFEATHTSRIALARVLAERGRHQDAIRLLGDVPSWRGRVDEKIDAWLMLCDEYIADRALDDAKHCVRRLETSGILSKARSVEISNRLIKIDNARNEATGTSPTPSPTTPAPAPSSPPAPATSPH